MLEPHRDTLRKLMSVKRCKTRTKIFALGISPANLEDFLSPSSIDSSISTVKVSLRDVDVAKTLGITYRRWTYVK